MSVNHRPTLPRRLLAPVLTIGLGLALGACTQEQARAPEPVRPVKVVKAEANAATREIVFSGAVKARVEASLGFRVAGKVAERLVSVGDSVAPGQVLARLDTADLALAVRSAEANVGSARSRRDVADAALSRNKALFAKGFIARSVLDARQLEFDQAAAALNAAISARDEAANQIAYADLKADAAGIVTEVRAEAGQVVAAGSPVVVVARDGDKEAAIAVPESEIRYFAVNKQLAARFWADRTIALTGTVREVAGSADPASRTFAVRVSLPADARLRLGMTTTVSAEVAADGGGIVLPTASLAERDGKPVVWIVDPASETVTARDVETAGFAADGIRIGSGVAPGELVVTAGTQFMTPGKKVRFASTPDSVASLRSATTNP
jgi:RND family efflux transporter MFP subunit